MLSKEKPNERRAFDSFYRCRGVTGKTTARFRVRSCVWLDAHRELGCERSEAARLCFAAFTSEAIIAAELTCTQLPIGTLV
jgi:hypothetical protein